MKLLAPVLAALASPLVLLGPPGSEGVADGKGGFFDESGGPRVFLVPDPANAASCSARRARVAQGMGSGVLALTAGEDGEGRFLPDDDFHWLTAISVPEAVVIVVAEDGEVAREVLFLPEKNPGFERWNGERLAPGEEATHRSGIAETRPLDEVDEVLGELLAEGPDFWAAGERFEALRDSLGHLKETASRVRNPARLLQPIQVVKDAAEVAAMRASIDVTQLALRDAMRVALPGAYEFTAEAAIESGFRRRGAAGLAFPTICGSGPNSCYLHYRSNERRLQDGDIMVMDVGAKYHHYCADVTRTIPVNGRFTPRQREIYTYVYEASRRAAQALKPGATIRDAHAVAEGYLDEKGYGEYFFHSVGHGLGLDVHDAPRGGERLEPGMVVTIEPGIYIADEDLGVRIEDDYLITEDGAELLSDDLPSHPDELETFLAELRGD